MELVAFKSAVRLLLTVVTLSCCLISPTAAAAVSPVSGCELYNDLYICTGAQYRMHCNTTKHHFYYQRNQNQHQYQCLSNDCVCVGNNDTCVCYNNTSSCFCDTFSSNISVPAADGLILDCTFNSGSYTCIGAQYNMYCDTALNSFRYDIYPFQNQKQYECWNYNNYYNYYYCSFTKNSCSCYSPTSSRFCTNYGYSTSLSSGQSPATIPDCVIYNDTYVCTGALYRMYCNTRIHYFYYQRNQNQIQYYCQNNNCNCNFNNNLCSCSSSTLSSCFCETLSNSTSLNINLPPVSAPDCELYNDTYICTGAQYRMYCNTQVHYLTYQRYQNQHQYQCVSNNCNCLGNKDTCTCSTSTLSSCFCETYGNITALTTSRSPVYECVLYNDLYICTGAQYRMFCNTSLHDFYHDINAHQCTSGICSCTGNKNTCLCSSSAPSSCYCKDFSNNITIPAGVSPVYDCVLYNDTYVCTGAQYRMFCNTSMHNFNYRRNTNQNQYQSRCWSNNCDCNGNKDTCGCYSRTLSSCFCESYGKSIALTAAVSPVYDCVLYKDTYICTGAQYRMYCNTSMHSFDYRRNTNQNQYQSRCLGNDCNCNSNKDTCTCSSSTWSSCYCESYGKSIALTTGVSPVSGCVFYNDTYVCTGAQYRMFCNTSLHNFYYDINGHQCTSSICSCTGNKNTCSCSSSAPSSCYCTDYSNKTIPAGVSPVYDCVLNNDTYICTGAQYRMFCNTSMNNIYYQRNTNQNQYQNQCWNNYCNCNGNKNTCTCSSSTLSSCFCETYGNITALTTARSPVYECVLYKDTYICTGVQYRMFCNTSMHSFDYQRNTNQNQYQSRCLGNDCNCNGNKDTCTCSSSTWSSCYCESYGKSISLTTGVSPVSGCVLYNDTYICTGAQYRMFCNTSLHNFYYDINAHQCTSSICSCTGNTNTCSCFSSAPSSCYCTDYSNNIIPAEVSPMYVCVLNKDTYVCTGAQYRMFCNTSMNNIYYQRNTNQNQYQSQCWSNYCNCYGYKDTCTCSRSTWSSCYCESYITTTTTPSPTTPALTITLPDQCTSQGGCLQNILQQLENVTQLPLSVVSTVLDMALNTSAVVLPSTDSKELAANGNRVLQASVKLLSALVKPTETSDNVSFTLDTVEVKVFSIGPKFASEQFPQLDTKTASMDIDLIGIAKSNEEKGSAAVAFMSYTTMENLLKADFFNSQNNTNKTMMSTVISATLPKTTNTALTKPVNFTFRHIREFDPNSSLSCVYWNISEWIVDGCSVLNSNSSHTVCSCVHLSTFALIMQTSSSPPPSDLLDLLGLVCVIVGLVFFSLALLSFALCQWSPGVNNVARINICISLLSAHLLFLLTQQFLSLIRPQQVLCVVIAGLLHFLFLSAFVWMFIEAVLLFISVKNLSQISSKKKEVLSSGFLCVIGYVLAMVVVCVSVGLVPEGYGSKHCWIKYDKGFIWSFLGPVCVILALNLILFIRIVIILNSALTKLNAEVSQMKQTKIILFKTLGQFVVLGCPWILGFFTNSSEVLEIVFLILNSQQGTFIFLIYCLLNNEIRQQYWKCFTFLCSGHKPSKIN